MFWEPSPTSSPSSSASSSPSTSPYTRSPSPAEAIVIRSSSRSSLSEQSSACAFPSWPVGNSLNQGCYSKGSAYISDADLDPDTFDDAALCVGFSHLGALPPPPPAPFRPALYLNPLPETMKQKKRRGSSRKHRKPAAPMTPIVESPR